MADAADASNAGWRLLRRSLWAQRRGLLGGIVVGLVWSIGKTAAPLLVQQAIDHGIRKQDTSLLLWVALLLGAGVVAAIFTGWRRYAAFRESRWAETALRERLFAHVQRLHFAFHDGVQTGNLMSRAASDLQQLQAFVVMIPLTVSNALMVIVAAVAMFLMHPMLALVALAPLTLVQAVARRFSRSIHPASLAIQREAGELAGVVEETVTGIRVVKGFGAEGRQRAALAAEADGVFHASLEAARVRARYLPINDALPNISLVLVLAYGGHLVLDGRLTVGQLVAFNAYVTLLVWPLRNLGQIVALAQRAAAALARVDEVLATDPAVADPEHPVHRRRRGAASIEFRDVRFGYGTGRNVLDGFNLTIEAGTSVAIVGSTASGKTTVARLLPRFYDVEDGSILIDGVDVRAVALADLRRTVGIVFEETFLFGDTVAANVAFAVPEATRDQIEGAARLAGAHDFINELPDGYETVIGERGFSLSGGQRQRIAIARTILADPSILILDDATSAVDPTKEHEIRDAVAQVMSRRTTLVIAHRPATIALAERVVVIDAGAIVEDGTHESLLASSQLYRTILASSAAPSDVA